MKLKLTETAKPVTRYEKDIKTNIIPVFEDLGFQFSFSRTMYDNSLQVNYFGTYLAKDGGKHAFKLQINTTHVGIDSDDVNLFLTLYISGVPIEIGAVNSKDSKGTKDLVKLALADNQDLLKMPEVKIPARDNSESHTLAEWKSLFKHNMNTMDPTAFGRWWNNVYPEVDDE